MRSERFPGGVLVFDSCNERGVIHDTPVRKRLCAFVDFLFLPFDRSRLNFSRAETIISHASNNRRIS